VTNQQLTLDTCRNTCGCLKRAHPGNIIGVVTGPNSLHQNCDHRINPAGTHSRLLCYQLSQVLWNSSSRKKKQTNKTNDFAFPQPSEAGTHHASLARSNHPLSFFRLCCVTLLAAGLLPSLVIFSHVVAFFFPPISKLMLIRDGCTLGTPRRNHVQFGKPMIALLKS
jgi:hypothetical protein